MPICFLQMYIVYCILVSPYKSEISMSSLTIILKDNLKILYIFYTYIERFKDSILIFSTRQVKV